MNLAELQEALVLDVTGRRSGGAALAAEVSCDGGGHTDARLDIYRDNVAGAHRSALSAAFPVVRQVLGKLYWEQLVRAEIPTYGSQSPDLHSYGAFMPELLATLLRKREELSDYAYLGELARLEWLVHKTRFCADEPVFDWQSFLASSTAVQGDVILVTSKKLTLFDSEYAVDGVWQSHHLAESKSLPAAPDGIHCSISRGRSFAVRVARVSAQETIMLRALQKGRSLNELHAEMDCEIDFIVRCLFEWIQQGHITGHADSARV